MGTRLRARKDRKQVGASAKAKAAHAASAHVKRSVTATNTQDLPALLVSLLGYPSLELNIAVLELLRRMAIYTVRVYSAHTLTPETLDM